MRNWVLAIAILFSLSAAGADEKSAPNQLPLKHAPWMSGQQMFQEYCASCHGAKGAGNGPAASACKNPPANLTSMAKRNQGRFPYDYFYAVMQFGALLPTPAHGSSDMPIWMPLFYSLDEGDKAIAEQRVQNLANYVASLQEK